MESCERRQTTRHKLDPSTAHSASEVGDRACLRASAQSRAATKDCGTKGAWVARRTFSAFGKREGRDGLAQTRKSKDKHAETSAERLGTVIIRIRISIFFG